MQQKFHNLISNISKLNFDQLKVVHDLTTSLLGNVYADNSRQVKDDQKEPKAKKLTQEEYEDAIFKLIKVGLHLRTARFSGYRNEIDLRNEVTKEIGIPAYWTYDKSCNTFHTTTGYIDNCKVPYRLPVDSRLGKYLMDFLIENNYDLDDVKDFRGQGRMLYLTSTQ